MRGPSWRLRWRDVKRPGAVGEVVEVAEAEVSSAAAPRKRTRRPNGSPRPRKIETRLDEEEYAAVVQASAEVGLTPSGFTATAAVASACGSRALLDAQVREARTELMAARAALGRIGGLLNQLAAAANSDAEVPPEQLRAVLSRVLSSAQRVDAAAAEVARRLR